MRMTEDFRLIEKMSHELCNKLILHNMDHTKPTADTSHTSVLQEYTDFLQGVIDTLDSYSRTRGLADKKITVAILMKTVLRPMMERPLQERPLFAIQMERATKEHCYHGRTYDTK